MSKRGSLQQNKNELEDVMKGLFSSIFVHRYRDVRPEIRAVCITELGYWLLNYRSGIYHNKGCGGGVGGWGFSGKLRASGEKVEFT